MQFSSSVYVYRACVVGKELGHKLQTYVMNGSVLNDQWVWIHNSPSICTHCGDTARTHSLEINYGSDYKKPWAHGQRDPLKYTVAYWPMGFGYAALSYCKRNK